MCCPPSPTGIKSCPIMLFYKLPARYFRGLRIVGAGELLTDFNKLVFSASQADFFSVLDLPFAVEVRVLRYFI